ncbi:PREDICTED: uncharacterized protein LOC108973567 [Bactrocera latifrons]|uniref:Uncharacterized protein n=1 Tax=Bactrocera latifrons TaxID=174628 RepID=A0A0K8VYE0_BACLA|nr:PREDICTED: uncharacterized protein LOC108973567 [Bactrocera latifrons]
MINLEDGRRSIAHFRRSVYGGDEVDFADIFQYDMDEDDHKQMLTVMRDSMMRLPGTFRSGILDKFVDDHPSLRWTVDEDEVDTGSGYTFESLIPSRWILIHDEFDRQLRSFSSTFSIRDPDKFWSIVQHKQQPHYEMARTLAIEKLANDVNTSLYMIYKLNDCKNKNFKLEDYEHFQVFSWTDDRFLARRQMKGVAWVDIFKKSLTENCLDAFKLRYDIMELVRLLKPYFISFCTKNSELAVQTLAMINNANSLLEMHNKIEEELEGSVALFMNKINEITNISLTRRSVGRDVVKNYFELETLAYIVRDPIEQRYHMNYLINRAAEWQDYTDKKENDIRQELEDINRKHNVELYCNASMMQCIYGIIQDYKTRIETMTVEYDRRMSELQDKNTKLKVGLDNMKMQKEFLMGEMEYMSAKVREIVPGGGPAEGVKRTKSKRSHVSVASRLSQVSRSSNRLRQSKLKQAK